MESTYTPTVCTWAIMALYFELTLNYPNNTSTMPPNPNKSSFLALKPREIIEISI